VKLLLPMKKTKVAIVAAWFAPYRIPLFRELARRNDIDLTVIFCLAVEEGRPWPLPRQLPFKFVLLDSSILMRFRFGQLYGEKGIIRYPKKLWRTLRNLRPDVVVAYEFHLECILAALYAAASGCAYVTWSDVTETFDAHMGKLRMMIRRLLLARSRSLIGSSSATLSYFRSRFRFPEGKSFLSILCAHIEEFRALVQPPSRIPGDAGSPVRFIYVGRLIPLKGLDRLIGEFAVMHGQIPRTTLTLVGEGPERHRIEQLALRSGCGEAVYIKSFLPHHQLAREMARYDVFVFPTLVDTFGLAVAEAIACGLPIICSRYAGAAGDLIEGNGIIVDPFRTGDLARAMTRLAADSNLRCAMSQANASILNRCSLPGAVDSFLAAIVAAVGHRPENFGEDLCRCGHRCSVSSSG
jgi:glycosyltransferase involved in cell wall biosynthesis